MQNATQSAPQNGLSGVALAQYRESFDALDSACLGFVTLDQAKDLFRESQLPPQDLSSIWQLSDVDRDGGLTPGEFICAMVLVSRRLDGIAIPTHLPPELESYVAPREGDRNLGQFIVRASKLARRVNMLCVLFVCCSRSCVLFVFSSLLFAFCHFIVIVV